MSKLSELLEHLRKPEVREVVLRSGEPPMLRVGADLITAGRKALTEEEIESSCEGSALVFLVAEARDVGIALGQLAHGGGTYAAQVEASDGSLEIRIARAGSAKAARVTRAPAPLNERTRPTKPPSRQSPPPSSRQSKPPSSRQSKPPSSRATARPRPKPAVDDLRSKATPKPSRASPRPKRESARPARRSAPPKLEAPVPSRQEAPVPSKQEAPAQPRSNRSLERILAEARGADASDVHVCSGQPTRVRRGGRLEPVGSAIPHDEVVTMLAAILPPARRAELDAVGSTDLALDSPGGGRLRANVTRTRAGWKGCFRLVAPRPQSLAELGLPEELARVATHHQGLVVISGPSGSGKTTTLAALVAMFNETRPIHVITVEDPVEVVHPVRRAVITQREVGTHTRSFATALKGALREDPDVLAIGELRDRETVEMALSAAETGHLVLATMNTPSGARTIDRLIDMFPPDVQSQVRATLAGALKMVIAQRLVTGVDGRSLVAAELITGGVPLWALIRENKLFQLPSLLQRGKALGMVRIEDSLNALLAKKAITVDEARLHADDPKLVGPTPAASPAEPAKKDEGIGGAIGRFFGKRGA